MVGKPKNLKKHPNPFRRTSRPLLRSLIPHVPPGNEPTWPREKPDYEALSRLAAIQAEIEQNNSLLRKRAKQGFGFTREEFRQLWQGVAARNWNLVFETEPTPEEIAACPTTKMRL